MSKLTVFLFPFAGGSKYSYHLFFKNCPEEIKLIPIEGPGRGGRMNEQPFRDMPSIVEDFVSTIKPLLTDNYAIYGHSMGALTGYLVSKRIREEALPMPSFLFFTGRQAPTINEESSIHHLSREMFWSKIVEYGGCHPEILKDEAMKNLFEPILRADFEAIEKYSFVPTEKLDIPIKVIVGSKEKIPPENVLLWKNESSGKVDIKMYEGDHFFIFEHAKSMMQEISSMLTCISLPPADVREE